MLQHFQLGLLIDSYYDCNALAIFPQVKLTGWPFYSCIIVEVFNASLWKIFQRVYLTTRISISLTVQ